MHAKMMLSLKPSYNTQVEEEIVIYIAENKYI